MINRIISSLFLGLAIVACASSARAQQNYPIQNGTLVQYIDYGGNYANVSSYGEYPETISGTLYYITASVHYTPNDPAATYGNITFLWYVNGEQQSQTETLTNISINPFTTTKAMLTANFAGSLFTGSLTWNIQVLSIRYGRYELENSFFTIG